MYQSVKTEVKVDSENKFSNSHPKINHKLFKQAINSAKNHQKIKCNAFKIIEKSPIKINDHQYNFLVC